MGGGRARRPVQTWVRPSRVATLPRVPDLEEVKKDTYTTRIVVVLLSSTVPQMQKKLTITIEESVYRGLYERVGAGRISRFIEDLVRPHVLEKELDDAYAAMARDRRREAEALEWSEGLLEDVSDDPG